MQLIAVILLGCKPMYKTYSNFSRITQQWKFAVNYTCTKFHWISFSYTYRFNWHDFARIKNKFVKT